MEFFTSPLYKLFVLSILLIFAVIQVMYIHRKYLLSLQEKYRKLAYAPYSKPKPVKPIDKSFSKLFLFIQGFKISYYKVGVFYILNSFWWRTGYRLGNLCGYFKKQTN